MFAWWANSTASSSWGSAVRHSILSEGGKRTTTVLLDQRMTGDEWNVVAVNATLAPGDTLEVDCQSSRLSQSASSDSCACVADAILVESSARFNDGSKLAGGTVHLESMDGIVLAADSCLQ